MTTHNTNGRGGKYFGTFSVVIPIQYVAAPCMLRTMFNQSTALNTDIMSRKVQRKKRNIKRITQTQKRSVWYDMYETEMCDYPHMKGDSCGHPGDKENVKCTTKMHRNSDETTICSCGNVIMTSLKL